MIPVTLDFSMEHTLVSDLQITVDDTRTLDSHVYGPLCLYSV